MRIVCTLILLLVLAAIVASKSYVVVTWKDDARRVHQVKRDIDSEVLPRVIKIPEKFVTKVTATVNFAVCARNERKKEIAANKQIYVLKSCSVYVKNDKGEWKLVVTLMKDDKAPPPL